MKYTDRLAEAYDRTKSIVCVGFDPDLKRIPVKDNDTEERIIRFFAELIDGMANQGIVNTVKPNYAYFAQYGFDGLRALKEIIDVAKENGFLVILDAKRADIEATSDAYAAEAFDFWQADAVTVNPYLGRDSIEPFLKHCERGKGVYVLAKTSNPGAKDFQELQYDDIPLYEQVIEKFIDPLVEGTGFVAGATHIEQLKRIYEKIDGKNVPLLIPGVGTQGGSVKDVLDTINKDEIHLHRINSSKAVIYAGEKNPGKNRLDASLDAIKKLNEEIETNSE